tara:strand:- start:33041 stop:33208 length:168 start_codon:yes stop_codon:yes gene_type:complete
MSSDTYEDEHGVWEVREEGGRTTMVLIQPKEKPKPAAKKEAKKGGKKGASSKKGN